MMDFQRANKDSKEASVCCPGCKEFKIVPLSKFTKLEKVYLAKCKCGHSFYVFFEKRVNPRKKTLLYGSFVLKGTEKDFPIKVVNLSRLGLCFTCEDYATVRIDDEIMIEFALDTPYQPMITCQGRVRCFKKGRVGVELTVIDSNKRDFGFYLF
jgi:hypothetical protein